MKGLVSQNNGNSIVEVLLSIAIFAIICSAGIGWIALLNKEVANTNTNASIQNAMVKVRAAFGDEDVYCTKILGLKPLTATTGSKVPIINFYNRNPTNNTPLGVALQLGQMVDQKAHLVVSDIAIKPLSAVATNIIVANLEITFSKADGGPNSVVRKFPLEAIVSGGTIQSCSASMSSSLAIASKTCEVTYDGYAFYDITTKKCVDFPAVKIFNGASPTVASCGAGYRPAVSKLNPDPGAVACHSSGPNGTNIPTRSYTNGFVDNGGGLGYVSTLNFATATCTFLYIASTNISAQKTTIRCVPVN